jgi:tetratricopeptide (TPR) repeat protein
MSSSLRVPGLQRVLCLGACLWGLTNAARAEDADPAREALLRARERFDERDYRGAALEYERALKAITPGPRRNDVLNNLALCFERAFAYDAAVEAYERYLREASPAEEERRELENVVRTLRDRLGGLRITSNVRAEVWVDETMRGTTPLDLALTGGEHVIELRAQGHRQERRGVRVVPRAQESVNLTLRQEARYTGPKAAYFWTSAGLSLAGVGIGSGLGLRALALNRQGERAPYFVTQDDRQHIRRLTAAADIAFGGAALFGASAFALFFLTDFHRDAGGRALQLSAVPVRSGLGIALKGAL